MTRFQLVMVCILSYDTFCCVFMCFIVKCYNIAFQLHFNAATIGQYDWSSDMFNVVVL